MSEIDQQFIEYVVKSLVGKPDAVKIERRIDEKGVLLELTVDPEDLGRVIGKRGATAQSLRTLLRALGTKNEARYNLKIIDNGDPEYSSKKDDKEAKPAKPAPKADDTATDDAVDDVKTEDAVKADEPEAVAEEPQQSPAEDDDATSDRLRQAR